MSKVRRSQCFRDNYSDEFDFIKKSRKGSEYALCIACNADINISHGGRCDIVSHGKTAKHAAAYGIMKNSSKISDFVSTAVDRARLRSSSATLNNNIQHPNSSEVKKFSCGRTKTGHLVQEIAKNTSSRIIQKLKCNVFSIATDGSNDSSDNQMYPIVVTFYDDVLELLSCTLVALPVLNASCTGQNIANIICAFFAEHSIPWENCLSFSCDNAKNMTGRIKGAGTFMKENHPNLLVFGCLCHLINLAAEKGAKTLPVSFDDFLIDVYYYFHKSGKRKLELKKFQMFDEEGGKKILKHCSTRWLSLGKCMNRLLEQWRSLLLYFKKECSKPKATTHFSPRISAYVIPKLQKQEASGEVETTGEGSKIKTTKRKAPDTAPVCSKKKKTKQKIDSNDGGKQCLKKKVSQENFKKLLGREDRIFFILSSNLYHSLAFFLKNVITIFEKYNVLFQYEEPMVHKTKRELTNFFTELLSRFVKISVISSSDSVFDIKYEISENQKPDEEIVVGSECKESIKELSAVDRAKFFSHVRKYFCASCDYIISNFPHNMPVLEHAEVADVSKRTEKTFSSVKYFVDIYPSLLPKDDKSFFNAVDRLESEFLSYQLDKNFESIIKIERADRQWAEISKEKDPLGKAKYATLSRVMLGILTFPHSNAACERVFSLVRKNKTDFRGSMNVSTLQAILIAKSQMSQPCYKQVFDEKFLKAAKSATTVALNKKN